MPTVRCLLCLSVGERVEVFWSVEDQWFDGVVKEVREDGCRVYYIMYDKEYWHGADVKIRSLEEEVGAMNALLGTPPGGWSDEN